MNFRTTLILLVVLIAVGLVILFTRDVNPADKPLSTDESKLLTIASADVTRISVVGDDGQKIVANKTDGKWHLTEPVKGAAEESTVVALVDGIANLKTRGQVDAGGTNAGNVGLDAPRFKVEVTTKDGKTTKLDIGSRTATGGSMYVKREGQTKADVVNVTISDTLEKPLKDWRSAKLFEVGSTAVSQLRIATTQGSVAIEKQGGDWKVSAPTSMPADPTVVSDLAIALTSLRAEDFVSSTTSPELTKRYGLEKANLSIAFSTAAPSTQPSASQPALTTIQFGGYDDVMKKNVFASISDQPGYVKVAAASLEQFKKKPIELRDKKLLSIEPDHVTKVTIETDKPATTQPTTREASKETVVLARNQQVVSASPSTAPSTGPASQASSQPAEPPAKWKLASKDNSDAEDSKVEQLLASLRPLRVDKYIESLPLVQVVPMISVKIETTDAVHELRFAHPDEGQPVTGTYNGLNFQIPHSLIDQLEGDFTKGSAPTTPPAGMQMPGGFPGMMPGGMQ